MLEHHANGFLAAGAELVGISDLNAEAASKAAAEYGVAATFDSPQAMLDGVAWGSPGAGDVELDAQNVSQ